MSTNKNTPSPNSPNSRNTGGSSPVVRLNGDRAPDPAEETLPPRLRLRTWTHHPALAGALKGRRDVSELSAAELVALRDRLCPQGDGVLADGCAGVGEQLTVYYAAMLAAEAKLRPVRALHKRADRARFAALALRAARLAGQAGGPARAARRN